MYTFLRICFFFFKWLFYLSSPFIFSSLIFFFYFRFVKKIKPIKNETKHFKKGSFFKRILFDFPRQFIYDRLTLDPNFFKEYGLHMLCGEQGSGKTILMAYLIRKFKFIYPRLKVRTNFECKVQDFSLHDWRELTLDTNGIYGELDCIDEIQNWFSSNASRNFPPDMLTIVTQQRKVRRCILATSQVFTRIAKPLRENTYLMYYPFTIFGCLTVVRVYKPILDVEGNLKEKKLRNLFFFVHDKKLREMFDTYKTICTLSESGFKEKGEQLHTDSPLEVKVTYPNC